VGNLVQARSHVNPVHRGPNRSHIPLASVSAFIA
jgi:hypothetical protein